MENAFVYELLFVIKYPVSPEKVTTSKNWGPVNPYTPANALQVLFKGVHFETFIAPYLAIAVFLAGLFPLPFSTMWYLQNYTFALGYLLKEWETS